MSQRPGLVSPATAEKVITVADRQPAQHIDVTPSALVQVNQEEAVTIRVPETRSAVSPAASPQISTLGVENSQRERSPHSVNSTEPLPRSHSISQDRAQKAIVERERPAAKRRKLNTSHTTEPEPQDSNIISTVQDVLPATDIDHEAQALSNTLEVGNSLQRAKPKPKPKSKPKTAKAKGKQRMEDVATAVVADAIERERQPLRSREKIKEGPRALRKGKKRATTPENAEIVEIVPTIVKMSDLCKDLHTGKKSLRAEEIRIFELEEAAKKQAAKQRGGDTQDAPSSETVNQLLERVGGGEAEQSGAVQPHPEFQLVNGEIVIVESSLRLDRHANAQAAREAEPVTVVEESALTHKSNSHSFMKREKRHNWNEEMTDLFYDGLRMFGTDFNMISKMFPGRSRASIKLKFTKEEKNDEERIKQTLLGDRIPVNMEEFSKMSNTTYNDPSELERDMEEDRRRLEEEQAREREAIDEVVRQRAAEAAAESAAVGGDSSAKENEIQGVEIENVGKKAGKRGRKGKAKMQKEGMRGKIRSAGGGAAGVGTVGRGS